MIERLIASSSGKVAFNTLAQVAGKAATLIISLIITALVTRSLGRAGYGDYSLARNFMLLFTLGVDFGLNAIVVREITRKKRATHRYFRNLLSLRLLLAIFFVLFGLSLLPFFPYPQTVKWGIVIALLILIPQGLYRSANTIFQANFRYDLSVIAFILGQLVSLGLVVLGVLQGWGLLFLIGAGLVGHGVMIIIALLFLGEFKVGFSLGGDLRLWKSLILVAFPLGLMLLFSQVNAKADLFLLSLLPLPKKFGLGSSETVGVYSLAYQIFNNAIILPTFFMNAFFPIIVTDQKKNWPQFTRRLKKTLVTLFWISFFGAGIGIIFAPWIIKIIAGEGFDHSVTALRILLLGLPLFYLSSPLQWFLVTTNKEKILPFIYGLAAVINILLNLVFIPRFSYQASAMIVLVVEGLILAFLAVSSWRAWVTRQNK
jgi:O-antigen/teichoic acid export membrane protein